jgi:dGTP triphosphohydrolase
MASKRLRDKQQLVLLAFSLCSFPLIRRHLQADHACAARTLDLHHPLLFYNATLEESARVFLEALKDLTTIYIVKLQSVQTLEYKGRFVIMSLFEALM